MRFLPDPVLYHPQIRIFPASILPEFFRKRPFCLPCLAAFSRLNRSYIKLYFGDQQHGFNVAGSNAPISARLAVGDVAQHLCSGQRVQLLRCKNFLFL